MSLSLIPLPPSSSSSSSIPHKHLYIICPSKTHKKFTCFNSKNPKKLNKKLTDASLATDLAAEVHKINTQLQETQNALNLTKQMLFSDFCKFLSMRPNDVKVKWVHLNEDDKLELVKGFVSDWGLDFHPLSPRSVRDLVDEFVVEDCVDEKGSNGDDYSFGFGVSKLREFFLGGFSKD